MAIVCPTKIVYKGAITQVAASVGPATNPTRMDNAKVLLQTANHTTILDNARNAHRVCNWFCTRTSYASHYLTTALWWTLGETACNVDYQTECLMTINSVICRLLTAKNMGMLASAPSVAKDSIWNLTPNLLLVSRIHPTAIARLAMASAWSVLIISYWVRGSASNPLKTA